MNRRIKLLMTSKVEVFSGGSQSYDCNESPFIGALLQVGLSDACSFCTVHGAYRSLFDAQLW